MCPIATGWANAEFRSYQFSDEVGDSASMIETAASCQRRRSSEKRLTEAEQIELREMTKESWEGHGFQLPTRSIALSNHIDG